MPGVLRTRVGYCGGNQLNPDYHDLKDHSETTQIQFDPRVVSYKQLLRIFWARHDYATPIEAQYKSAILFNNAHQQAEALESLELVKKGEWGQEQYKDKEVLTVIEPATKFYIAEIFHQKYFLQCNPEIFSLLKYKCRDDLTECPIATSLNGYLHGSGTVGAFMQEVDTWPISFAAKYVIFLKVTEGKGLSGFKPIDMSHIENPLPGPFPVFEDSNMGDSVHVVAGQRAATIRRYEDIVGDYSTTFPAKTYRF